MRPLLVVDGHGGEDGHADARRFRREDDIDVLIAHSPGQHGARVGAEGVIDAMIKQGIDVDDAIADRFALFANHAVDTF